ncbi:AAA family ATPase [Sutcliffiella horikoshii]|uniref:AAA family ATPase n=1 Tax=Sutcliffiella horikoshii TaxID=79883 RepID=UPI003CF60F2F
MSELIMVQGVSSNSGKSVITKSLCRYFSNKGLKVTSFKPILFIEDEIECTERTTDIRLYESMQACRAPLTLLNNPIQIKFNNKQISTARLIIEDTEEFDIDLFGRDTPLINRLSTDQIFKIKNSIKKCLIELSENYDLIVIEGAGNPTDLGTLDLTNYFILKEFDVKTLLVTKLSAGGAAASLLGTYSLLEKEIQKTVIGYILNDFINGEEKLLEIEGKISSLTKLKYLGCFPHIWNEIKTLPLEEQLERLANSIETNINIQRNVEFV